MPWFGLNVGVLLIKILVLKFNLCAVVLRQKAFGDVRDQHPGLRESCLPVM